MVRDVEDSSGEDLVRVYLREIGRHPLLGADQEVTFAKAIEAGVDKVIFTGSSRNGREVLGQLAEQGIPSVMELSGNDPVIILPGANLSRVVAALRFGNSPIPQFGSIKVRSTAAVFLS